MKKQLSIFLVALLVLVAAGVFVRKHKTDDVGAFSASASRANTSPSPEDAVLAAYRLLEKAYRESDGTLLLGLQSHEATAEMTDEQRKNFPKRFPPDPLHAKPGQPPPIQRSLTPIRTTPSLG